eukprot:gb/GECG01006399.1/.p1 GENE.gb/GECG01006399.1/~~gb/GECG01006399.1/.p1  ORF type:complete len:102 (+),score=6.65 gb/GECG01006399.1/:1-306(+)
MYLQYSVGLAFTARMVRLHQMLQHYALKDMLVQRAAQSQFHANSADFKTRVDKQAVCLVHRDFPARREEQSNPEFVYKDTTVLQAPVLNMSSRALWGRLII